uniref:Uncharacterized protein n=1 Tax=Cuerna arida TaxID=1464854 RepID=A0A1B6GZ37_9HEMI
MFCPNRPPQRILNLIEEKHVLRRRWQRHRHPEDTCRKIKSELYIFKINNYQKYLSEINPGDSSMWLATKRILRTPSTIPPLQQGQETYQSDSEKCEVFVNYFENSFSPNPTVNLQTEDEVNSFLNSTILSAELPTQYISTSEIINVIQYLPLS